MARFESVVVLAARTSAGTEARPTPARGRVVAGAGQFYTAARMLEHQETIAALSGRGYDLLEVAVELLLIGLAVHWLATMLHGTRGTRPLRALLVLLVIVTLVVRVISVRLGWTRLDLLYRYFVLGLGTVALVAFQPELRRAVFRISDVRLFRRKRPQQSKLANALVKAAANLSKNKQGALIAIERSVNLQGWAENGTLLNAEVSANLLNSIFFPNSPLHDMGVIIRGTRVVAANCQFPLAEGDEVDSTLGSRHLAAIAMSYETDALLLVVSEETGAIAIADNGELQRFLSIDDLAGELETRLESHDGDGAPLAIGPHGRGWRRVWRYARHWLTVGVLTATVWYLADQSTQIEVEGAKLELTIATPEQNRSVDLLAPSPPLFSVTLRGPARAVNALRNAALYEPLRVTWVMPAGEQTGERAMTSASIFAQLSELRSRGIQPVTVRPEQVRFRLDEQVSVTMPLKVAAGDVGVEDAVIEPPQALVTIRARDLETIPTEQRFVSVPVAARLADARNGQVASLSGVPVSDRVAGARAIVTPKQANVTLRVAGQRAQRKLTGVPVHFRVSPRILENYQVERLDPNEFLVDITVQGERNLVNSFDARDVRAFVEIDGRLEPPSESFRSVEVGFHLPRGVELVPPAQTVQIRLVPRAASR